MEAAGDYVQRNRSAWNRKAADHVAAGERNCCTLGGQKPGRGSPQAATGTKYQCHPPSNSEIHTPLR